MLKFLIFLGQSYEIDQGKAYLPLPDRRGDFVIRNRQLYFCVAYVKLSPLAIWNCIANFC